MKHLLILTVFLLVNIHQIYGQSIEGHVFNENKQALEKANIKISGTTLGTSTNKNGYFRFQNIAIGLHTIEISYIGYETIFDTIYVESDSLTHLQYSLIPILVNIQEVIIVPQSLENYDKIALPIRIKLIDAPLIQSLPATSTIQLFNTTSGIDIYSDFGIFSTSQSIGLRGIGSGTQAGTLIILDGMPLNKSDGGSVNWNIIDKEQIQQIEIIKGPASVLFGSNAMGGIINIISKEPSALLSGIACIEYGTYNTFSQKLQLSGLSKKNIYWKTFFSNRRSDGYINTPLEIIILNDSIIVPVFVKELFMGGMLGIQLNANHTIEMSSHFFNDIRGRGIKIYEDIGANIARNTSLNFIKYKGKIRNNKIYANIYGLFEEYNRLNEYYSNGEYKLYEVDASRRDMGIRTWSDKNIYKTIEIIFGAEYKTGNVNASDIYYTSTDVISNKGRLDILSAFIQGKFKSKNTKWTLIPGLRYDYAFFSDATFSIEKPSYSIEYLVHYQFENIDKSYWKSASPKMTVQFQPNSNNSYYLSVAKGFRSPILDDLCRNETVRQGFRIANPNIQPEYIYNYEIGTDIQLLPLGNVQLSSYLMQGYDFMYLMNTGDTANLGYILAPIYQTGNIGKVNIYGIEFDFSKDIFQNFNLYANYTFTHASISEYKINLNATYNNLTGKFLTNIPMHKYSCGAHVTTRIINFSLSGKFSGERWIKNDNSVDFSYLWIDKYPSYFIANAKIWKTIKDKLTVSIDFDNIFNSVYINNRGYLSPGRMIFGKIQYSFTSNKQ